MNSSASETHSHRMMPPRYVAISLFLVALSRIAVPAWSFTDIWTVAAGVALLCAGIALNLLADSAFKHRRTTVKPDEQPSALIRSGVFGLTRNPMYLGMTFIIGGIALVIGTPVGLLVATAFAITMNRIFIPGEERNLETAFGQEYRDYARSVHRWL